MRDTGNSRRQTKPWPWPQDSGPVTHSFLSSHVRIRSMRWKPGSDVMYGLWYFSGIACEISLSAIAVSVGRFYYYTRH